LRRIFCAIGLLAALGVPIAPGQAGADTGQIVVYFDSLGVERFQDPPPALGQLDTLYVYGERFLIPFVSGAQYRIDYGPALTFIADVGTPPVTIGRSDQGISLAFAGADLKRGPKFLVHKALVTWATNTCAEANSDFPKVEEHPLFPNPTPIVIAFPGGQSVPAIGGRSQTCQRVEMDIQPGECPNLFDSTLWDTTSVSDRKGGVTSVAVLGSASVNVSAIDPASCRLEGVAPIGVLGIKDVSTPDETTSCLCNASGGDGFEDLRLDFLSREVAERLASPPAVASTVELGFASPNPFNPVTRIAYSVAERQRIRLSVFDVRGRLVETLVDAVKSPGDYVVEWNASRLASGVYFYRLRAADYTVVRRAALIK
jgi:hypothetical protein